MSELVNHETGEIIETLSTFEQRKLTHAEVAIRNGLESFLEVGEALAEIRESRLYRQQHRTFEAYCEERWGITDRRARQFIDAADITASLPTGTFVPVTESQARELVGLDPEVAAEVMTSVADTTLNKPTAAAIREARERIAPKLDYAALSVAAMTEFPDLAYYVEQGRERDVVNMADDLRRFRERGELDMRLDNLRRSICVDRAERDGTYRPGTTAVMNEAGEYEMRPLPTTESAIPTCPTCGQNIRSEQ